MDPVIVGIAWLAFLWIAIRLGTRSSPVIKPDSFSQGGVVVNYAARTIAINGKVYPVTAVRSVRWESAHNHSVAFITVADDMATPVHRIQFSGTWNRDTAQTFIARLEAAIAQAGGPHFK
jgi:hypothetical protein